MTDMPLPPAPQTVGLQVATFDAKMDALLGDAENIIKVSFGREQRESARKLASLLEMVDARDEEMLLNPKMFFDRAVGEIVRLREIIRDAQACLVQPIEFLSDAPDLCRPEMKTIVVDADEWRRMMAMRAVIDRVSR